MKTLTYLGTILIAIALYYLFYRKEGHYGFGGYVDNSTEIIIVTTFLMALGISLILLSRKKT